MVENTPDAHFIGPMGSEFWQIKVPPEAVPLLAWKIDWNVLGRRVMIDPIAGIISWMNPSGPHVDMTDATDKIVEQAGKISNVLVKNRRDYRWKKPEDPPNTGVEADASFYIGEKAERWIAAYRYGGRDAANAYEKKTPPDLVVEVEVTNLDENKPTRYATLGVREMWQVEELKDQGSYRTNVVVLDLQARGGPRQVVKSQVLPGLPSASLPKAYHLAQALMLDDLLTLLGKKLVVPQQPVKKKEQPQGGPRM